MSKWMKSINLNAYSRKYIRIEHITISLQGNRGCNVRTWSLRSSSLSSFVFTSCSAFRTLITDPRINKRDCTLSGTFTVIRCNIPRMHIKGTDSLSISFSTSFSISFSGKHSSSSSSTPLATIFSDSFDTWKSAFDTCCVKMQVPQVISGVFSIRARTTWC